jgi:hypothetical protein
MSDEILQGELVLVKPRKLVIKGRGEYDPPYRIGVLLNNQAREGILSGACFLKQAYALLPPLKYGEIVLPIVRSACTAVQHVAEVFVGRGEIIGKLEQMPELRGHVEWISELQRPYDLRPRSFFLTRRFLELFGVDSQGR